jgi:hypothetical protein
MADLSADDIIRIMRRIGYSDDQILEVGPDVHDALLLSGAAVIGRGKRTEAVLRVNTEYVIVRSRDYGSMIYNLRQAGFGLMRGRP